MCQIMIFDDKATSNPAAIYDALEDSVLANRDGIGYMYVDDGKVQWHKALQMDLQELAVKLSVLPRPIVVHTRMATHGAVCKSLAHPFPLTVANDGQGTDPVGAMVHNGIFTPWRVLAAVLDKYPKGDKWSDTKVLHMAARKIGWRGMVRAVEADGGDRLAILRPSNKQALTLVGKFERERTILVSSPFWDGYSMASTYFHGWNDMQDDPRDVRGANAVAEWNGKRGASRDWFTDAHGVVRRYLPAPRSTIAGLPVVNSTEADHMPLWGKGQPALTVPGVPPPIWCPRCQDHHRSPCPRLTAEESGS